MAQKRPFSGNTWALSAHPDRSPLLRCQATLKLTPPTTLKLTPLLNICRGWVMDRNAVDLVNLHVEQVRPPERTEVSLPHVQEDHGMLKPDVVDQILEWAGQGIRVKEIARRLGIARNSVRRYLAGARVGFQDRPAARRLDLATQRKVEGLFGSVAEGNTVVIQQEL